MTSEETTISFWGATGLPEKRRGKCAIIEAVLSYDQRCKGVIDGVTLGVGVEESQTLRTNPPHPPK